MRPERYQQRHLLALLALWLIAACQSPSGTANDPRELRVITSGGFAAAYNVLSPAFEQESGVKVLTEYGSSSGGAPDSIPERLRRGEIFDVVILSRPSFENLKAEGFVVAESRRDLARSLIGMAVRAGAKVPDISTTEKFRQLLLDAESIGYSASASGTYLSTVLFPELGLWEQLAPKSTRVLSERVATVVARGDVEIGFQQVSEILPIEGALFVGPIPDEYQSVTTFSAGITGRAVNTADAAKLVAYLSSAPVAAAIRVTGLEPVVAEH